MTAQVVVAAWAAAGGVLLWAWRTGRLLLYGDATAHVAIARRMVDSRTPGLSQWGTVWLPLPHLLQAPLATSLAMWRSGLSGAVVSVLAFGLATGFLYRIVARGLGETAGLWAAALFALNPSLLYLAAVPMTETVYLACFLGVVDACAAGRAHRAGLWALAACLCRYDGWFLLPFAGLALWPRGWGARCRFAAWAAAGPAFWLLYNHWYFDDALAFARGPYSARQLALRAARPGVPLYPGDHNLWLACLYYGKAVALTAGLPLLLLALAGWAVSRPWRHAGWLLAVPVAWYVWAMWSGNVPIFVPAYWPHGYYNVRYAVQALPLLALGAAALLCRLRFRRWATAAAGGIVAASLLLMLRGPGALAYAEAAHNAPPRLAMQQNLARALAPWRAGETVLLFCGSFPGALAEDGIPLRATINESNFLVFQEALGAPQRYAAWVVVESGTPVGKLIDRAALKRYYHPVAEFTAPGNPEVSVYRRESR